MTSMKSTVKITVPYLCDNYYLICCWTNFDLNIKQIIYTTHNYQIIFAIAATVRNSAENLLPGPFCNFILLW